VAAADYVGPDGVNALAAEGDAGPPAGFLGKTDQSVDFAAGIGVGLRLWWQRIFDVDVPRLPEFECVVDDINERDIAGRSAANLGQRPVA